MFFLLCFFITLDISYTAGFFKFMVVVPGFLAGFLTGLSGQGLWDRNCSFTVTPGRRDTVLQFYWDGKLQVYSSTGTKKNDKKYNVFKTLCVKQPIYQKSNVLNASLCIPGPGIFLHFLMCFSYV